MLGTRSNATRQFQGVGVFQREMKYSFQLEIFKNKLGINR